METETQYRPRIVKEIWVSHNGKEIAFASPAVGPTNYRNAGKLILENGQKVPTGDYTASLLHPAYCDDSVKNVPEFANVRDIMHKDWLWVFNKPLWTDKGVYVVQDREATGRSRPLSIDELEKMLKGGKEINGIRFSNDKDIRFAPKESYILGEHSPESLAKDGFIIASYGEEGAEKLGEVSSKFRKKPCIYGVNVEKGQTPEQRVSAVDGLGNRLFFLGLWGDDGGCHAFGVWK